LKKIININFNQNIINIVADYILDSNKKTAVISGGRRPFLFIKKKLAQKIKKAFFAPDFYTNDEFIEQFVFEKLNLVKIQDIEAVYVIYEIIRKEFPHLMKNSHSFASFLEWAQEIFSFIEQLDLEDVSEEKLKAVKANAEIGYDVPENINNLLKDIFWIRENFHKKLDESFLTTKGLSFFKTARLSNQDIAYGFDEIILLAPFYLYKTEIKIFKRIYDTGKLTVFIQGNPNEYDILKNLYREFGEPVPHIKTCRCTYDLNIYSAVDDQSQSSCLKNLISSYSESDLDKTIVVVADPKMLQCVVSEVSAVTDKYNVAAGYPAVKTAVFCLLNEIVEAQLSRRGKYYRSKDFIKVLMNPLFKNMRFFGESAVSRIIVHKIEEALSPDSNKQMSGKMFISFEDIIADKKLISDIGKNITGAWEYLRPEKIVNILNEISKNFFTSWEIIKSFADLSDAVSNFLSKLYRTSAVGTYPLNVEAMDILLSMSDEMKHGSVSEAEFTHEEIFSIFKKLLKNKKISLPGSPLKGLQILGLLESRNLSFENVFVVGMADSAIPAIKRNYSLVPKDIMYTLGIEMTYKEYEIQKYHFNRLIAGSKKLNLIYPDNEKEDRSRFIESIIWKRQFENRDLNALRVNKFVLPKFSLKKTSKQKYLKTNQIREYLKTIPYTYSKIDTYLRCRLKFYFQYVLSLDDKGGIGDDIDGSDIGTFIHGFLKDVFHENLVNEEVQTREFEEYFFKELDNKFNSFSCFCFREDAFLIKEVFNDRMRKILEKERQREFKKIYGCEKEYNSVIKTDSGGMYKLNCRIDRIDSDGVNCMIFDYKTGYVPENIILESRLDAISFNRHDIKKSVKSLQLPLYKYIFERETGLKVSQCGLYDVKRADITVFPPEQSLYEKCCGILRSVIDEINSSGFFEFDEEDEITCGTCKYFYICR
jgi:hypothetical protein